MTVELERFEGYVCESCEAHVDEDDIESALYECGNCSTVFTRESSANYNHQCPQCHKFGSKIADKGCPECNEGELTEFKGWACTVCDTYFEGDEKPEHDCVLDLEKARIKKLSKLKSQVATVESVAMGDIEVGDRVFIPDEVGQTAYEFFKQERTRLAMPVYRIEPDTPEEVGLSFGGMTLVGHPSFQVFKEKDG